MAYSVFLSHSEADADWVQWIAAKAKPLGINVYLHEHDPQPGTPVANKVKRAIAKSDALVVLLTHNSQNSSYVQQEIGYAEGRGKRVIPLVQPGVDQRSLAMLEGREYIPFDFRDLQKSFNTLLTYLQKLKQAKENELAVLMGFGALVLTVWLANRE